MAFKEQEDFSKAIPDYIIRPKQKEFNCTKTLMVSEFEYKLQGFMRLSEYIEGQIPLKFKFKICFQIADLITAKHLETNTRPTPLFFGNLFYCEAEKGIKYLLCNCETSQMLYFNSIDLQVINRTQKDIDLSELMISLNTNNEKKEIEQNFSLLYFLFDFIFNKFEKRMTIKEKEIIKEEEIESKLDEVIGHSLNEKIVQKLKEYLHLVTNTSKTETNINELKTFLSEINQDFKSEIQIPIPSQKEEDTNKKK